MGALVGLALPAGCSSIASAVGLAATVSRQRIFFNHSRYRITFKSPLCSRSNHCQELMEQSHEFSDDDIEAHLLSE
eukprot:1591939-Amphidinium_carterae.1